MSVAANNVTIEQCKSENMLGSFLKNRLLDYIFPIFCLGCEKEGEWLCTECAVMIDWKSFLACPICRKENANGAKCSSCQLSFLEAHAALLVYKEGELAARLIELLKYDFIEEALAFFDEPFRRLIESHPSFFHSLTEIVPVPLHKKRYAERGFNQAETIARMAGQRLKLPVLDCLLRIKKTKQQATLSRDERRENVADAFALRPGTDVTGKSILLIDDVYTTGSTMQSSAEALADAGAARVVGFTLARA